MNHKEAGKNFLNSAKKYEPQIVKFLRDMIAIQAESCKEKARCQRVKKEYESLGFDEVFFDGLGSVVARIGNGPFKIMMDGHVDCVGVGDPASWKYDPFKGKLEDGKVFGRGAVDELPAIASMAYGAKILKESLDPSFPQKATLYLVASVMEEDCDGYPLWHIIEKEKIKPDVVVLGEPTDMCIYRGHRGRMEITVVTHGVSAHGAHSEKGVNAVYKMAPIIKDIEALNEKLPRDEFLGKGSITVSTIDCKSPSLCSVPDQARIFLDRRLTMGETKEKALKEIRELPHIGDAKVELLMYDADAWTGTKAKQEKYFPTWVIPETHPLVQSGAEAAEAVLGKKPKISRWHFSTNGVATMGRLAIPTIGFAPGLEELSHSTGEWVKVEELVSAAAVYAMMPIVLASKF